MKEIGAWLQKERTDRGMSLEYIKDETKIGTHYLRAIEEGAFNRLPGEPYVKAYIRAYAKTVGCDPDPVLAKYQELRLKESFAEQLEQRSPRKERKFLAKVNQTLQWFGL